MPQTALVVLEHNNTILLLRDARHPERLKLPGGKVDAGETCAQAAIRELIEEVGISLSKEHLRVLCEAHFVWNDLTYHYTIYTVASDTHNWKALAINGEPEECIELVWADKHNLPTSMLPPIREAVEKAFKQQAQE